ncbi:homeobox domain-containing protein [Aspergillus homomorphus CBS 101889]|uniref:Homeobox transcription factor n=1 Tax=Aspergillus homomorphus (strain CBS 101889) TaxID=1450537 RepID=A0A395I1Q0_ASPHC|nr:homeobox transcription factor [Aspergillus homomorphus CBS 101889]RAL13665.1 homeobox transcription factor [Aspergillus homomorphus CBS 101889]
MQPAAIKAENAFPAVAVAGSSSPVRPIGGAIPHSDPVNRTAGIETETLAQMRLEKINQSEAHLPHAQGIDNSPTAKETTPEPKLEDFQDKEKGDGDAAMASSDEGVASSENGDKKQSPDKHDKKKMKRFRLTHNQTRFLMSEFTRQAHPDAAHRERLSKEIPGLTPRQVQVWFQNRRAKLKRLTSNDRERILKSRALPDDFDTTQVLRTPFDHRTTSEAPMLLTDGIPRNDDDYVISPLSSASTTNGFAPTGSDRHFDNYAHSAALANRGAHTPLTDMSRHNRGAFPFPRSSSFSESSFHNGLHYPGRFSRPGLEPLVHPSMAYGRRPMEYGISRPANGMVVGYDHQRAIEGSVSPIGQSDQPAHYSVDGHNQQAHNYHSSMAMPAPKGFGSVDMNAHMQQQQQQQQQHGRQIPSMQSIPISEAPDYRPYSYDHHPYSMNTAMPYSQANASSMSLPASFPSETNSVSQGPVVSTAEDRINNPPQLIDPLRAKIGTQTFEYANYL